MKWKEKILNHLDRDYTEPIRDTMWGHVYLSAELKRITGTVPFQRLGRIKQLGPAFHVYPGATHTRLAHSFGVFHIAKKMIRRLLCSPGCPELSLSGVKAFLVASLFHDLGHFPYAHSLKELPLTDHEILSGRLIQADPLAEHIRNEFQLDPAYVAAIVDKKMDDLGSREIQFFRNILSGVLDPDKLDYLNRDAFFCGVPYGMQDIDFVITRIIPHSDYGIGISEQGINAIENILFSKYLMYKTVYWHKTVRIATAMVKKAVILALNGGAVSSEELYEIDDNQFTLLFSGRDSLLSDLIGKVTNRDLFKTAAEIDFDPENEVHNKLVDISERGDYERFLSKLLSEELGQEIGEASVIIDVPEPISFEIDLPIFYDAGIVSFNKSESVFSPPVIRGFTNSLRKIRLILPSVFLRKITDRGLDPERYIL